MEPVDLEVLKNSRDQRELKKTASKLAQGADKEALKNLCWFLDNDDFLLRLDVPEDYEGSYIHLRLASVMKVLMNNPEPIAQYVLIWLTTASTYLSDTSRIMLLIRALAEIRPSPQEAIQYWNQYSLPDSPLVYNVIEALCINQSDPAMLLLEQKIVHLQIPQSRHKLVWMRSIIMPKRNDEPLLLCSEKVIASGLSDELRLGLVEVLFDYRPEEWYVGCDKPKPPARELASEMAQQTLRRIGQFALDNMALDDGFRETVENVLESLES